MTLRKSMFLSTSFIIIMMKLLFLLETRALWLHLSTIILSITSVPLLQVNGCLPHFIQQLYYFTHKDVSTETVF